MVMVQRPLILVIDDEKDILKLLQFNLEKEGYRVLLAKTGEEGLIQAQSKNPDLVILDLMLPGIDHQSAYDISERLDTLLPEQAALRDYLQRDRLLLSSCSATCLLAQIILRRGNCRASHCYNLWIRKIN